MKNFSKCTAKAFSLKLCDDFSSLSTISTTDIIRLNSKQKRIFFTKPISPILYKTNFSNQPKGQQHSSAIPIEPQAYRRKRTSMHMQYHNTTANDHCLATAHTHATPVNYGNFSLLKIVTYSHVIIFH